MGVLLLILSLIGSVLVALGCVRYALSVHTRVSVALATGAVGMLIVSIWSRVILLYVVPALTSSPDGLARIGRLTQATTAFSLFFQLVFAIALFLTLRGISRRAFGQGDERPAMHSVSGIPT